MTKSEVEGATVERRPERGRSLLAGAFLGLGAVAMTDEVIFHQILHWHHFYDRSTTSAGLVSDGLFHAFSWFATVAGFYLVVMAIRDRTLWVRALVGGFVTAVGAFQLYDGLVQHKLMGLHQIRYEVDLLPYDLTWNILAAVLLVCGAAIIASTYRQEPVRTASR
ncbi:MULTISPECIES: DUF2243 domain-containing protein [unclassified Rhodococcus (in: high G+C Gram-positive bacteria)]|uniref:DUF2243 domain-containing protein n=1 Tax=unclassified Rhodococcus (in: high G+C Gram-positive bacteria) TaxID=192944 RepID=UPI00146CFE80|nr:MULTISPECIES: DUF2243 domain-containing protein [unclassified Rhodococcus (in: high G+C Gram-positive bacteria)]MBF0660989.1 DUF2243 domain-containing protein [Rhodococcus sp. (in: high G+C Gram-positive bacteria)]NME77664.1 DUF2243 domain-containing protein [Rhodococcus sp. 105337]